MKQLFSIVAFFALTATAMHASAQSPVTATINDQMQITLPADQPLAAEYVVDITGKFKSEAGLTHFCETFRDMGITFRGDFTAGKLYIIPLGLTDSTGKTWDATRWNAYFESRAPKMQYYLQTMNQ